MRDERFERLYDEHAQGLFGFLVYRTGDRALAEDLVADTFERALRARRRFDPRKGSAKTWLYSIALNRLRDHARRAASEGRALETLEGRAAGSEPAEGREAELVAQRATLAHALEALAPEEREAIALRFAGDLSLKEIARVTGVPMTTAEGRVYRALGKLRDLLEE